MGISRRLELGHNILRTLGGLRVYL